MQHNVEVIKGMGWYHADDVAARADEFVQDIPDASSLPAMLVDLHARCDAHAGSFVWLGLFEPSRPELQAVADAFGLDHLEVEDAANPAQRAKFDAGDHGQVFALLKLLDYVPGTSDVETGQLAIFIGSWFAVTVRQGNVGDLTGVRGRIEGSPELRAHGPYAVLYAVIDAVVDGYVAVVDEVSEDVSEVETEVFAADTTATSAQRIYNLKRENQEVRRAVSPLVGAAHRFANEDLESVPADLRPYFQDIGEHILRVYEQAESADSLLLTLLMASTALQDLQQNRDMRKISAWVAIGVVPTVIGAIYGMNFEDMPELEYRFGYPLVLGGMVLICALLYRAFKKSGWL